VAVAFITACADGDAGLDPAPGGGVIELQVAQSGLLLNRTLSLSLDGATAVELLKPVSPEGGWRRLFVPTGTHEVELIGLAPNCRAAAGTRMTVAVERQEAAKVVFDVQCTAEEVLPRGEAAYLTSGEWENSQLWFVGQDGVPRKANKDAEDYAWAPDGERLAVHSWGKVAVINRAGGVVTEDLFPGTAAGDVDWAPDGEAIAAVHSASTCLVSIADGPAWGTRRTVRCGEKPPSEINWSPVSDEIALGAHPGAAEVRVSILSTRTGVRTELPVLRPYSGINGLAWSPDGARLAIGLLRGTQLVATIYDLSTRVFTEVLALEGGTSTGGTLQWLSDGSGLLVGPVADTYVGLGGVSQCEMVAVVPLATPEAWRPLLPCGERLMRFSIPRRVR
jgi:hypothetical protein